jgi:hypothetical protein
MFLKAILREMRLTLVEIKESRFWGIWILALLALCIWGYRILGKG